MFKLSWTKTQQILCTSISRELRPFDNNSMVLKILWWFIQRDSLSDLIHSSHYRSLSMCCSFYREIPSHIETPLEFCNVIQLILIPVCSHICSLLSILTTHPFSLSLLSFRQTLPQMDLIYIWRGKKYTKIYCYFGWISVFEFKIKRKLSLCL